MIQKPRFSNHLTKLGTIFTRIVKRLGTIHTQRFNSSCSFPKQFVLPTQCTLYNLVRECE
jgi:hypothetical protein